MINPMNYNTYDDASQTGMSAGLGRQPEPSHAAGRSVDELRYERGAKTRQRWVQGIVPAESKFFGEASNGLYSNNQSRVRFVTNHRIP
jgi:hypothetical protein